MKKTLFILIPVVLLLVGACVYFYVTLDKQKQENKAMLELAELDKQEMENEYRQFAVQYGEMKAQLTNDSLVAQLTAEQEKTERLLQELKNVKSNDAREIARLKKELSTMREVLRSYVIEIDSLNRLNQDLQSENERIRQENEQATRQIEGLNSERAVLNEKVAMAAQLDATGINLQLINKKGKVVKNINKAKKIQVSFAVAKNVTAQNGMKTFYVQVHTPTGNVLNGGGSFTYEGKTLKATIKKSAEYGGKEIQLTLYADITQSLVEGTYRVSIFADGNMIGSRSFSLD